MKKNLLGAVLLLIAALGLSACGSAQPASTTPSAQAASARPPETGTNIPRIVREKGVRSKTTRPASAKPTREKTKPEKPAKREAEDDFVPRGGFR